MTLSPESDKPDTLDAVLNDVWRLLECGARDGKHGFHLPVLATSMPDGRPDARTVVLQGVDPVRRAITCHSDRRSPKLAHLRQQPWGGWVFYDPQLRVQVRAAGPVAVLTPDDAEQAARSWEQSNTSSRRCYLGPNPPSIPSASPSANLPEHLLAKNPTEQESEQGRQNFCVLSCELAEMDWLMLRYDGHRRARFTWSGQDVSAQWIEP